MDFLSRWDWQHMVRRPVESRLLASVGYDPETRSLEVELRDGTLRLYEDVPRLFYKNMVKSSSIGRYFNTYIKGVFAEILVA
jgi:hypothetical protein